MQIYTPPSQSKIMFVPYNFCLSPLAWFHCHRGQIFLLLCLLSSLPPSFFLLFLLFNSYLSNLVAHEQQNGPSLKSTKVSGWHVSKMQACQPTGAGCPLKADFSQTACIILAMRERLQPSPSWQHGE